MSVGPVVRDDVTANFFDGTGRGELLLARCPQGHFSEPAAEQCLTCGSPDVERTPAGGGARVVSWAVTRGRPRGDEPGKRTVLVIGELDEGPWWWAQLLDADPDALKEGTLIRLDFQRFDDAHEAVPVFRLA